MNNNLLTQRINTYFALLILTVFIAGGAFIILHVVSSVSYAEIASSTTSYTAALLQ